MAIDLISILTGLSSISGIIAIIFVIWDHIKDERRLTKRVQKFHEDIEKYIYSSTKIAIHFNLYNQCPNIKSQILQEYLENLRIKQTSLEFIRQTFNEYSKYLGITTDHENHIINSKKNWMMLI